MLDKQDYNRRMDTADRTPQEEEQCEAFARRLEGDELDGYYTMDADDSVRPVYSLQAWATWRKQGIRHIGYTTIGSVRISTVFLGIDHAVGGGPPLLFETMIFGGELDEEQIRYATAVEARAGHEQMVRRVTALRRLGEGDTA